MNYVSVCSLEKYQHYKDRHMVWFKFYLDILQNFQFMELTEREKWVFIGIICLACKSDNRVPMDESWLNRTLNTKESIKSIESLSASKLLAICYQDAIPIREEKIREEEIIDTKTKFASLVTLTQKEYDTLKTAHGEPAANKMISILDNYKGAHGRKYKSDYKAILTWVVDRYYKDNPKLSIATHMSPPSPELVAAEKRMEEERKRSHK